MQIREIADHESAWTARARIGARSCSWHRAFDASVVAGRRRRRASARNIVAVMLLAAAVGTTVRVETDGPDELAAMTALVSICSSDGLARRRSAAASRREARSHGELRAARHRRLGRHRHRPRAARLARDARGRALHDPARARSPSEIARFDAAIARGAARARGPARRDDVAATRRASSARSSTCTG